MLLQPRCHGESSETETMSLAWYHFGCHHRDVQPSGWNDFGCHSFGVQKHVTITVMIIVIVVIVIIIVIVVICPVHS